LRISRFQAELSKLAKDAGKLPRALRFPRLSQQFSGADRGGLKPAREPACCVIPFGSDFTDTEQRLIPGLQILQDAATDPAQVARLLWQGFTQQPEADGPGMPARLGLDRPATLSEHAYRALVSAACCGAGRNNFIVVPA